MTGLTDKIDQSMDIIIDYIEKHEDHQFILKELVDVLKLTEKYIPSDKTILE